LPREAPPAAAGSRTAAALAPRALRLGVAGPVGSGKTTLVAALCRALGGELALAVVVNDPHGGEDGLRLREAGALAADRIAAVQTGCSPQAAIREDIAANLEAVEALEAAHAPLDLVIVESGGTDLTACFSRGLVDRQIFVLDAAAGERVVRKGGPALVHADLLLVNRTDLAPLVGAELETLRRDALAVRSLGPGGAPREQPRPTLFTSLAEHPDAPAVADWVRALTIEGAAPVDA
jgi:urease accessory protein